MIYTRYFETKEVNGFFYNLIGFLNSPIFDYNDDFNFEFISVKFESCTRKESVILHVVNNNYSGLNGIIRYDIKKLKENGMFFDECELMNWVEFGGDIPKPKKQDDLDAGVDR